jgi:hypothetical protein
MSRITKNEAQAAAKTLLTSKVEESKTKIEKLKKMVHKTYVSKLPKGLYPIFKKNKEYFPNLKYFQINGNYNRILNFSIDAPRDKNCYRIIPDSMGIYQRSGILG